MHPRLYHRGRSYNPIVRQSDGPIVYNMCNMGSETVYSPKKGQEHRKHDIIDGQTIGRATQELKKTHI